MMPKWSLKNNIGAETEQAENGRKGKLEKQEAIAVVAKVKNLLFTCFLPAWLNIVLRKTEIMFSTP